MSGGAGLGFLESCLVLEQVGRTTAPVPYFGTVLAAMTVDRHGDDETRTSVIGPALSGESVLTVALTEPDGPSEDPTTQATPSTSSSDGDEWRLHGTKLLVPFGREADRVVVSARIGENETGVFLLDPSGDGVDLEDLITTSGRPETTLVLDGAPGARLGDGDTLTWLLEHATAAQCATAIGVCASALDLTAEYTKTREQFDRPIATFQAVGQRAADAYIDTEAVRLTAWQAVWRLAEGLDAAEQVAIAKFWTAEAGQRVVHAAQHLHGGVGVDRDYPLHRYFLWAKELELNLGGATQSLLGLGARLAAQPI